MMASGGWTLAGAATALEVAADKIVDAAAVLGENQRQEESPGELSACGCAVAIAAKDLTIADSALGKSEWSEAAFALGDVAESLRTAATPFLDDALGAALMAAADELEDASNVTGCMSLAAAAGPNVAAAADHLAEAATAVESRGESLASGPTAAHVTAGAALREAAEAIEGAARGVREAGERLEG